MKTGMLKLLGIALALAMISSLFVFAAPVSAEYVPQYSGWSAAVNLGPVVNSSTAYDACPTISQDGLSLYFRSNRTGGLGGYDIWVSQRNSLVDSWKDPVNLGPTVNGTSNEYCSCFSSDGHYMIFVSDRTGGSGGLDLYMSYRKDTSNEFGWEAPKNLGSSMNSSVSDMGPCLVDDAATGQTLLYFSSARVNNQLDIYVSTVVSLANNVFGPPTLVAELSTSYGDQQPMVRKDGLEVIFVSNRPGTLGSNDLWVSTRARTTDPWSQPVNLGPNVNSSASDFHPTLSWDGTTLIFASERLGTTNADLYMCTRNQTSNGTLGNIPVTPDYIWGLFRIIMRLFHR